MIKTRLLFIFPLLLAVMLTSCGGSGTSESQKKSFLDSLYRPAGYRTMLDSLRIYENLNSGDLDQLKAFMRENADYLTGKWTYRDLHTNAAGYARTMQAPVGMDIQGLTPRTDRKIAEFRFDLKFKNQSGLPLRRFHARVIWIDEEGNELDRSPRFAVDQKLDPDQSTPELRLQYAYYRPTGNEMNETKNEELRRKVDAMLQQAKGKSIDSARFRLEVSDLLLDNGLGVAEYWRMTPQQQAAAPPNSWPAAVPLLSWADKNKDRVAKLQNPVGSQFLMVTPILTDKFEATHGTYLIFDRIDKFSGFFIGQLHIPSEKIIQDPAGKLIHTEVLDFWKWPMEIRIYEQ
jgi:hypothetical protein